jgi:hypothetical protein
MPSFVPPPLTTESPTTHYCTVQHHVPIDPYAERMPRADNTIRDSISRVAPCLRGPGLPLVRRHGALQRAARAYTDALCGPAATLRPRPRV